jgi:hypothetical protein
MKGLEAEFDETAQKDAERRGESLRMSGRLGESEERSGPNEHGKALMSCRRFPH